MAVEGRTQVLVLFFNNQQSQPHRGNSLAATDCNLEMYDIYIHSYSNPTQRLTAAIHT